jgi:hypothetical protein
LKDKNPSVTPVPPVSGSAGSSQKTHRFMPTYIHSANLIINKSAIEQKVKGGCTSFGEHEIFTNIELNQERLLAFIQKYFRI